MKKLLIANRGEIAVRIIRTAREMGIKTVAVHSKCDEHALHVRLADESVCIGGNRAKDSYLNMVSVLSACELTGADAIHPGYGFLSENAEFAEAVIDCGVTFVGPTADGMRKLGAKVSAREIAKEADVPLLPGTGVIQDVEVAKVFAAQTGYPILIKASNGGGGRGMRVVNKEEDLEDTLRSARSESQTAFGSSDVFLEKFVQRPRHVEIQIAADKQGNVIHFGERECSTQRRHQKVIEEAPAIGITEKDRQRIGACACRLAKISSYEGLGTVEFLMDDDNQFYFMELNSRIQVEHPVTEQVTGVDLVRLQLNIAKGEPLPFKQEDIRMKGHAIECRVNAEDPENFIPCPGEVKTYVAPGGRNVRVDSAAYAGYKVPPFYDSMIAKLICWGDTREDAIKTMDRALDEFVIEGIKTNIPLHKRILASSDFQESKHYTRWLEEVFL